jgi:hypothetical protein
LILYIVVEGETEFKVLPTWVQVINPTLARVNALALLTENTFYLISGRGYPNYLRMVANAAEDSRQLGKNVRLVVVADAEEEQPPARRVEIESVVGQLPPNVDLRVVVANCCFESWALGNRRVCTPNIQNRDLREFRGYYDVRRSDPELMATSNPERWNRAHFACRYLALLLQERQAVYSKTNPWYLAKRSYFEALQQRVNDTCHIATFGEFVGAVS